MASISVTIPNPVLSRILDAFAAEYNRPDTVLNEQGEQVSNPESEADFAKRKVMEYIKSVTKSYEAKAAAETARQAALDAAESEITLS